MPIRDHDLADLMRRVAVVPAPAPPPGEPSFWQQIIAQAARERALALRLADQLKAGALHDTLRLLVRAYGTIECLATRVEADEAVIAKLEKQKGDSKCRA